MESPADRVERMQTEASEYYYRCSFVGPLTLAVINGVFLICQLYKMSRAFGFSEVKYQSNNIKGCSIIERLPGTAQLSFDCPEFPIILMWSRVIFPLLLHYFDVQFYKRYKRWPLYSRKSMHCKSRIYLF